MKDAVVFAYRIGLVVRKRFATDSEEQEGEQNVGRAKKRGKSEKAVARKRVALHEAHILLSLPHRILLLQAYSSITW